MQLKHMDVAEAYAGFVAELCQQPTSDAAAQRAVELARKLFTCRGASIWTMDNRRTPVARANTDPDLVAGIRDNVPDRRQGVAWTCLTKGQVVRVDDFHEDARWPDLVATIRDKTALRSAIGFPLTVAKESFGALVIYSDVPGEFAGETSPLGATFAIHLSLALQSARAAERVAHLEQALLSNRQIGTAIGILMAHHQMTQQHAFNLLRKASQHENVKLAAIAERVVHTGSLS